MMIPWIEDVVIEKEVLIDCETHLIKKKQNFTEKRVKTEMIPILDELGNKIGEHAKVCYKEEKVKLIKPVLKMNREKKQSYDVCILGICSIKEDQIVAPNWILYRENFWWIK